MPQTTPETLDATDESTTPQNLPAGPFTLLLREVTAFTGTLTLCLEDASGNSITTDQTFTAEGAYTGDSSGKDGLSWYVYATTVSAGSMEVSFHTD